MISNVGSVFVFDSLQPYCFEIERWGEYLRPTGEEVTGGGGDLQNEFCYLYNSLNVLVWLNQVR